MSKRNAADFSFEERGRLASQVKRLRREAGMTQKQLAEYAGISRQALSNIERGSVPQFENLSRIYEVLGVDLIPHEFSAETSTWLAIVGGILDALPEERRGRAGQAAVNAVTQELVALTKSGGERSSAEQGEASPAPISLAERRANVGGSSENGVQIPEDVEQAWADKVAAHDDTEEPIDHD